VLKCHLKVTAITLLRLCFCRFLWITGHTIR